MIYSYEQITPKAEVSVDETIGSISYVTKIMVQTPAGFELEQVTEVNPNGDTGTTPMVFDPVETAKADSGRVYMRAARIVERMRSGDNGFARVD